jgi:hypothetical protein
MRQKIDNDELMLSFPEEPERAQPPTPPPHNCALGVVKKGGLGLLNAGKTIVVSEGVAFICSNAVFDLLTTICGGYPTLVANLAKQFAKYQIPAVAIPVVLIAALRDIKFRGSEEPYRLVMAAMSGLGLTTFTIPMAMELVTRVTQILDHESRNAPVNISNAFAGFIEGVCGVAGILQAIQTYYKQINAISGEAEKSRLNKLMTHSVSNVIFGALNSGSGVHAAVFALMKLFEVHTADPVPYYTRMGITFFAGAAGAVALGGAHPENRKSAKIFEGLLNLVKLSALGLTFVETFYLSPHARDVFGEEVIDEQSLLWSVIIPSIPAIILLLQFAGLQGPKLMKALSHVVSNIIACCKTENAENQPLLLNEEAQSRVTVISSNPDIEEEPSLATP